MTRSVAPILLLVACGRSAAPGGGERRPVTDAAVEHVSDAVIADAAVATAAPDASPPHARGDHCSTATDCNWDDPCGGTRCVHGSAKQPLGCEETAPKLGTCGCVDNQCTLRSSDPARGASAPGCTKDDECAVDVGAAACVLGGDTLIGPIHQQGPVCTCDAATTRCQWSYVGPIACESWRDCSWIKKPRLRPVASKLVPRPVAKPVRACKDGEVDSVCTNKVCTIVGWSC